MERCSRDAPILPSDIVMVGVAAAIHHNTKNHKDDDRNDLQQTEPIFELISKRSATERKMASENAGTYLAICSNCKDIGSDESKPEDQTDGPARKIVGPVL